MEQQENFSVKKAKQLGNKGRYIDRRKTTNHAFSNSDNGKAYSQTNDSVYSKVKRSAEKAKRSRESLMTFSTLLYPEPESNRHASEGTGV